MKTLAKSVSSGDQETGLKPLAFHDCTTELSRPSAKSRPQSRDIKANPAQQPQAFSSPFDRLAALILPLGTVALSILTPLRWDLADPLPDRARRLLELAPGDPPLVLQLDWPDQALGGQDTSTAPFPQALSQQLNGAEQTRLAAFRLPQDRWRHGLARSGLKRLLAQVLGVEPLTLEIQAGPRGKPYLAPSAAVPSPPQFNGSHAGDLVLLALHPSQAVGVDTERLDRRLDRQRLAPRLLSSQQLGELDHLPPAQQRAVLLGQWCRLEAQLKCSGQGLAGLEALRQGLASRPPRANLVDLALPAGYCGALAWDQPARPPQPLMRSNSASTAA